MVLKPLLQLAHDQKQQNIRATDKIIYESKTVAELNAFEKVLVRSKRAL